MSAFQDFLAQANASINKAAQEQAVREALAAVFLNVPSEHPTAKKLAGETQRLFEADKAARQPTERQARRRAGQRAGARALPSQLADLGGARRKAAKSIADEIDRQERLSDAASAYLGILDKTDPAVRRLAQSMDSLVKKPVSGAEALKKAYEGMQRSALTAAATTAAFGASIRHMAGAANPGLMAAFDGSLQLLQTRLAGALLPQIDWTIDAIMSMADWFASLSEGGKKLVAGGALAVPLLVGLNHALRDLAPAGKAALDVFKKFAAIAKENATVATGSVASVSALLSAAAIWNLDRKAGPSSEEARGIGQQAGSVTVEEMRALRFTDEQIAALSSRDEKRKQEAADAIVRQDYRRTEWQHLFHPEAAEDQKRAVESVLERVFRPGAGAVSREETDWRKRVGYQAMRVSAVQMENKPQYSGLSEVRKGIQLQLLGKNQYEKEILAEQRKHRDTERKQLDELIRQGRDKGYRFLES